MSNIKWILTVFSTLTYVFFWTTFTQMSKKNMHGGYRVTCFITSVGGVYEYTYVVLDARPRFGPSFSSGLLS